MSGTVRVVVVVDHPVLRAELCGLLEDADGLEFTGEARDAAEALTLCRAHPPDVALIDLRTSSTRGVAATAVLAAELPDVRVLMLGMPADDASLVAARRAGARGNALQGAAPHEILRAIHAVAAGRATGPADRLSGTEPDPAARLP